MATVRPFKAWRPEPDKAEQIVSVPYDVIDTEEAKELARGNPLSFLHVIRPEIDLPDPTNLYDSLVYEQGKKNLATLLNSGHFLQEKEPSLYLYQLVWKGESQTGIFGCVSVKEYDEELIVKHERTRPDKEDDRTRHILTQRAHAEPVMLTFKTNDRIWLLISENMNAEPLYEIQAEDEVVHRIWKIKNNQAFTEAFREIPQLYIADGHHRCASASRVAHEIGAEKEGEHLYFPAVLFPMDQMRILAYNRIVYSIPDNFIELLNEKFELLETSDPVPSSKGEICLYDGTNWYRLSLPQTKESGVAATLDVARLQEYILEPMLGISNQRTDKNINFVGGIRGTQALENLVDRGVAELAISLYPTSIDELVAVSDAGQLMPPKSTWFEPKLRSGFLIHSF